MKKYIAEALGTGTLTLVVGLSLAGVFPISTPILAGLVVGLFVYSVGAISGAHFNPAVSIGLWSLKKIEGKEVIGYIIAQFIGAAVAMFIVSSTVGRPDLDVASSLPIFAAELVGIFFLIFGIASFVYGNTSKDMSGIVVGGSLVLGITIASLLGSNGVLNPAVALGVGSFNLVYILGPIAGSLLGAHTYRFLSK